MERAHTIGGVADRELWLLVRLVDGPVQVGVGEVAVEEVEQAEELLVAEGVDEVEEDFQVGADVVMLPPLDGGKGVRADVYGAAEVAYGDVLLQAQLVQALTQTGYELVYLPVEQGFLSFCFHTFHVVFELNYIYFLNCFNIVAHMSATRFS